MDATDFLNFIIRPALIAVGLNSDSAQVLLLGTAMVESDLTFLEQKGPGKALGLYQMEEATYLDLLRYLNKYENSALKERCLSACYYGGWPASDPLIHNLRWATICARLKYLPFPRKLPAYDDEEGMAAYHKDCYNTRKGKTDTHSSVKVFEYAISEFKRQD